MKNKHLEFEERIVIEEGLNKGMSVNAIAIKLGRPASSVAREIKRNRHVSSNTPYALSELLLGKDFLEALEYRLIPADDVILKPYLLKK